MREGGYPRLLMADQADTGQASPAAATAVKGLFRWLLRFPLLSPAAFFLQVGPAGVFKGGDGLVDSVTCLLYTSPSPRDKRQSRMPSSA